MHEAQAMDVASDVVLLREPAQKLWNELHKLRQNSTLLEVSLVRRFPIQRAPNISEDTGRTP